MLIVRLCAALLFFCMAGCLTYVLYVAVRPWNLDERSKWGEVDPDTVREIDAAMRRSGGHPRN